MLESKKYEPPKLSAASAALTLARAGVGSLPIIGAAATQLLNSIVEPMLSKRRQEWMETIAQGLLSLEEKQGVPLDSLQSNDAFIDTVLRTTQSAMATSQQEKKDALRNAVLNAASPNPPEASVQQMYLNFIDRFTEWHLRILRLLSGPILWYKEHNRPPLQRAITSSLSAIIEDAYSDMRGRQELYDQIMTDLHGAGLLSTSQLHTMMTPEGALEKYTTPFGDQFLRFIIAPTAPPGS